MGNSSKSNPKSLANLRQLAVTLPLAQERNIPREQLVELKFQEEKLGLYQLSDIEAFCTQDQEIGAILEIRNYSSNQHFHPLHLHPSFQRRNRNHVTPDSGDEPLAQIISPNNQYLLLLKGKKSRPMSLEQIQELLGKREILYTHMVSPDNGTNWYKIFQLQGMNRREEDLSPDLPYRPEEELFENTAVILRQKLLGPSDNQNCQQAIINFAHLGLVQSGKTKSLLSDNSSDRINNPEHGNSAIDDSTIDEIMDEHEDKSKWQDRENDSKGKYLKALGAITAVIILLFIFGIFFFPDNRSDNRPEIATTKNKNGIYRATETSKTQHTFPSTGNDFPDNSPPSNNLQRKKDMARKLINQQKEKRQVKDANSKIFHEVDEYPTDDFESPIIDSSQNSMESDLEGNNLPVEQDPVRSQLSKHLIDPPDSLLEDDLPYNPEEASPPFPMDEIRENFKVNGNNNFQPEEYFPPEGEYLD